MKKWGKRLAVLMLCVITLSAAVPVAHGATVYFMAVNDTFLDLNDTSMPTVVNGVLYVPYTMLSAQDTGVNLDVYASYSSAKKRVLVFSSQKQLIFDLENDQTYDMDGTPYPERAVMRNSMAYIPVARVCTVFPEIKYSLNSTNYGYLVRIVNDSAVLSDADFIDAAANPMKNALSRYEAEHPTKEPTPSAPVVAPSIGSGAAVYLGFALEEINGVDSLLDALDAGESRGLFFFTPEQLEKWDDLVRRLVGEGHFVGLRTDEQETERAAAELAKGQEMLALVAHCRGSAVLAPGLDGAGQESLEQMGYVCWQTTVDGRELEGSSYLRAARIMDDMTGGEEARNYLLLDQRSGNVLSGVLTELLREDYQLRTPVAPEL